MIAALYIGDLILLPVLAVLIIFGLWSEDFRDGVLAMSDAARDYGPYVLLSAAGLAVLAFRRMRMR